MQTHVYTLTYSGEVHVMRAYAHILIAMQVILEVQGTQSIFTRNCSYQQQYQQFLDDVPHIYTLHCKKYIHSVTHTLQTYTC